MIDIPHRVPRVYSPPAEARHCQSPDISFVIARSQLSICKVLNTFVIILTDKIMIIIVINPDLDRAEVLHFLIC